MESDFDGDLEGDVPEDAPEDVSGEVSEPEPTAPDGDAGWDDDGTPPNLTDPPDPLASNSGDELPALIDEDAAEEYADLDEPPSPDDHPVTEPIGADPDLPGADDDPATDLFPLPLLDLDEIPAPAGGPPWVDPAVLGATDGATGLPMGTPDGALADLVAADATDPDAPWEALRTAEDPAVRALARFWNPPAPA